MGIVPDASNDCLIPQKPYLDGKECAVNTLLKEAAPERSPADYWRLLRRHPQFRGFPRVALKRLAAGATVSEYPKGTILCEQGEPCRKVYVVLSGRCKSVTRNLRGKAGVSIIAPGCVIGRRALVSGGINDADVSVASDALLIAMDATLVMEAMAGHRAALGSFAEAMEACELTAVDASGKTGAVSGCGMGKRIVGFGFLLWNEARSRMLADVAESVATMTGEAVLAVELRASDGVGPTLASWEDCRCHLDGGFCFESRLEDQGMWKRLCLRAQDDAPAATGASIASLLGHMNRHFPYVLIGVETGADPARAAAFLVQTDVGFLFADACEGELEKLRNVRSEEAARTASAPARMVPVIAPAGDSGTFPDFDWIAEKSGFPVDSIQRGVRGGSGYRGFVRHLARTVARLRIGLALSSGSARGLAHIGVIEVLEEQGIEVDVVVGTSMGAYVGACWCAGNTPEELRGLAGDVRDRRGVWRLADPILPPRTGFVRGNKIRDRLRASIRGARFEDLGREFQVVATNLDSLEEGIFRSGDVATAVHASLAMPGVCAPVVIDGTRYTDGAACMPLPVRILEDMGIERIIAVNVLPSQAELHAQERVTKFELAGRAPRRGLLRRIGAFLNHHLNYFAPGNLLDTVMRGLQAGQIRLAEGAGHRADVYIHAHPKASRWFRFDHHDAYIKAGRDAALEQLAALKQLSATPTLTK